MSPQNLYEQTLEELGPVAPQAVEDNPYAATLKEQTTREEAAFRVAQQAAQQTTPDRAAAAQRLADDTGLPPAVVERNFDEIQKRVGASPESYARQRRDAPALTTWLADPHHAAVAQDDLGPLAALERLITLPSRAFAQQLNQQRYAALRFRQGLLGESLTRAEQDLMQSYQAQAQTDLGTGEGWVPKMLAGTGSFLANQAPVAYYGAAGALEVGAAGAVAGSVLPGVGTVGGGLTGAGYGARAGLVYGVLKSTFQQEAAGAFDEYTTDPTFKDEAGRPIDPAVARMAALGVGGINAAIEAGLQSVLLQSIPGLRNLTGGALRSQVKQLLLKPTVRAALLAFGKTYGKVLTTETAQEVAQRAITILSGELAKLASGQDIPLKAPGAIVGELADEGVEAATSFALPLLAGPLLGLAGGVAHARQGQAQQDYFTAIGEGMKESTTFQRLPAAAQAFIAHVTKDGPVENVYLDPTTFTQFFQSKGLDPARVAQELLGNAEAYPEAVRTGEALVIPTAAYAVKLAPTEHNAFFAQELRFAPGEMNARERTAYAEVLERTFAEATAAAAAAPPTTEATPAQAADPIYASLYTQLLGTGQSRALAHGNATLAANWFQALGRAGVDPVAYFQRRGWIITGPAAVDDATLRTREAARAARAAGVSSEETANAAEVSATPEPGVGLSDVGEEQRRPDQGGVVEGRGDGDGAERGGVSPAAGESGAAAADLDDVYVRQSAESTAARVTPDVTREVVRLLDEMETFPYVGRTWNWLEGKKTGNAAGGAADIVAGHGGAAVYDDILALAPVNRATSGRRKGQAARRARGSRGDVIAAIQAVLAGTVDTNLAEGVLRVAERRAAGDWRDLSKPELPHADALIAPPALTDALADAIDDALAAGEGEGDTSFDVGEFELAAGAAEGAVDVLETGELQPRLPGAEAVRETEQATPEFDAPFALTAEAAPVPGKQGPLFQGPAPPAALTDTPAFRAWFGNSQVVDPAGRPLVVHHGTARGDRVANIFRKGRATSGPMAFFTADREIAQKYAAGKPDTSLEPPADYGGWFKFKPAGSRTEVDLDRAWWHLTPDQRATVLERLPTVGYADPDQGTGPIVANSTSIGGRDHVEFVLKREARGNGLTAAKEIWLSSGALFDQEERFLDVLEALGVGGRFRYDDPHATQAKVYDVYLSLQRPLNTSAIPTNVMEALERRARRQPSRVSEVGADFWDKRLRRASDWMAQLKEDYAKGENSFVWSSIPDWVTATLKELGYDGIHDTGGKMGGPIHDVWIPFEPTQIKSVANVGTFDPTRLSILYQSPVAPAPTFYSRLTRAVESSTLAKASGAQWKATIANAKTGINRDEFAYARVADLADGTVYTKADVLAYLAANTLTLEDVTLGEATGPTNEEVRTRAEELYEAAVQEELGRLEDSDEDYYEQIDYGTSFNEEEGAWEATVAGADLGEWFETQEEADAAVDARVQEVRETQEESRQDELMQWARDHVDYDDAYNEAQQALRRAHDEARDRAQYAEYVEPGAVPGSYREVFLTVPQVRSEKSVPALTGLTGEELYELHLNGWDVALEQIAQLVADGGTNAARAQVDHIVEHQTVGRMQQLFQKLQQNLIWEKVAKPLTWEDGHDAYSDITNPVVRLRFNERTVPGPPIVRRRVIQPYQPFLDRGDDTTRYRVAVEGVTAQELRAKGEHRAVQVFDTLAEAEADLAAHPTYAEPTTQRVLFLEEVQLPHEDQPMPPLLRKHGHEIAFKWALRHAAEQGFDVLALTTGAMQVARYSLEKQVQEIRWGSLVEGTRAWEGGARQYVAVELKQGATLRLTLNADGVLVDVGNTSSDAQRWTGAPLENVLGKEIAARILAGVPAGEEAGTLEGEGLKIGGEGLKRLYDVDFPRIINKLPAVKAAGGRVTTVPLPTSRAGLFDIVQTSTAQSTAGEVWRVVDRRSNIFVPEAPAFTSKQEAEAWARISETTADVPALALTPAIKAAVLGGQPLFQAAAADAPRAAVTFTPAAIQIQLFAGADASSFMHEAAHIFLEIHGDIADDLRSRDPATLTPAQVKFVADYDAALRWLGVSHRGQITVAHHEQFARGWEAYLREGTAPSKELRSVFAQFRGWLLTLYQSLAQLDVVLTPEVRAIFDRMLASDEAIAAAAAEPQVQPLFTTAESAGMTEEAFAQYRSLVQAASDQAKAELSARLYRDWERERSAQGMAARERIRAAVTAEVQQEPVYRARAAMRTGTHPDGTPLVPGQPPTPIRVNLNPLLLPAEGEISLDAAAELFGFTSGDELAQALRTAPTQRRVIAAKTNARLRAELGDVPLQRAVLREKADEAVYGAGRQVVVQAELKALTAGLQRGVIPPAALLRQHARERIRATRIRDLRPGVFLVAAQRASARAFDLKESDRAGAVQAKQQELVNLALYREAVAARDAAEAQATWVRTHDREAARRRLGKAGASYLEQWDGLLERFEFKRVPQARLDQRAAIAAWAAAQEADNVPVDLPALLLDESQRTNYQNLTVDELDQVLEGLQHLTHLARLKNRLLTAQRNRDFTVAVDTITTSLRTHKPSTALPLEFLPKDVTARKVMAWVAAHKKLANLVRAMDGYQDGGPLWEYLMQPINAAATREAALNQEATVAIGRILTRAYTGRDLAQLHTTQYIPAIQGSLSKEARLMVALNWGNEGNRQRLRDGRQWTDAQVTAILDTLDARDVRFVQDVWDYIDTYREAIFAKQRRVTGVAPTAVEATPFVTQHGTSRGGYFPLVYDGRLSARAGSFIDVEQANLQKQAAYVKATTRRGHTEARAAQVKEPIRLELSAFYGHVEQVIHDLSHHEMLIDVGRLLGDRRMQQAIYETHGDLVYRQLKDALVDIAYGARPASNAAEQAINYLRQGTTVAGLAWNVWTAVQQPMGVFNGMARVGPTWVLRGMTHMLRDAASMESTARWVYERSEMMRLRHTTQQREISELRNTVSQAGGWFDTILRRASKDTLTQQDLASSYFWLIGQAQRLADLPTWIGQYEKSMAAGETEDRAVALAEQAVLDAQGGGQIKDLAQVQRGSATFKLFTNFYSYGSLLYNQTADAYGQTNFRRAGSVGQFAGNLLLLYAFPAFASVLLAHAFGRDDDEESWLGAMGREMVGQALNTMVLLRELGSLARLGANRGYGGPAGTRPIGAAIELATQAEQGELDRGLLRATEDVAGMLFRLPLAQVQRSIDGFVALQNGQTQNPLALLTGPPRK